MDWYKSIRDEQNEKLSSLQSTIQEIRNYYSELIKNKSHERDEKIKSIQREIDKLNCEIICKYLPFKIGDMIYYQCKGSGYYGIFKGVEDNQLIMEVCTKGGTPKNYEFRTYLDTDYYYFSKVEK